MSETLTNGVMGSGSSPITVEATPAGTFSTDAAYPPLGDSTVLLAEDEQVCANCGKAIKKAALKCRFCSYVLDSVLRQEQTRNQADLARLERMRAYLRQSGVGWLVVAALQFVLSGFLSAAWGVVCVVMGVINLAFPVRAVLAVNGLTMMFIGVANAGGSLSSGSPGFMVYLGIMQVVWGFNELRKFATGEVQDKKK